MDANKVEYKVFAEKGIVIATIRPDSYEVFDEFNHKYLAQATSGLELDTAMTRASVHFMMPKKIVAIAKCHPEDNFNEETGKRIAFKKLKNKLERSKNKRLYRVLTCLRNSIALLGSDLESRDF